MEPATGPSHYTETLIRLPGIGTDYALPAVPDATRRARASAFDDAAPLLLCPQSLFKIHPDNDAMFARVLRGGARGAARDVRRAASETDRQVQRPDSPPRSRAKVSAWMAAWSFLPQCGHDDFLRINAVCDAMLDTQRWSGGNTSLDALAAGLPIVTLPGRFMRGRQSAAMLSLAGLAELVATDVDDYVRIASARRDRRAVARSGLRARIRDGRGRVFNDAAPVAALASALEALVRSGAAGATHPPSPTSA